MNEERHSLIAYLATLGAIVGMTIAAAIICTTVDLETHLAKIVAALGFIGAAVTGLIGVIGTFRPKSQGLSEDNAKALIDKQPPPTGEAADGS